MAIVYQFDIEQTIDEHINKQSLPFKNKDAKDVFPYRKNNKQVYDKHSTLSLPCIKTVES